MINFGAPTGADIEHFVKHARKSDKQEAFDMFDVKNFGLLLRGSVEGSEECVVARDPEGPVGLFGVTEVGQVWLIGVDRMTRYQRHLIRDARATVDRWVQSHPILFNWVSSKNTQSIQWLRRLGFTVKVETPLQRRVPFYPFYRKA